MRALALSVCFWLLWLPQAAFAWSLNVPPGTPTVNTPIGMWYLHPDIHFDNVPADGSGGIGWPLSINVAANNAGSTLRGQLGQFGFCSVVGDGVLISEGTIMMDDGVNYVIQTTPHLKQYGLGFVLQFRTRITETNRYTIAVQTNNWTPVTSLATDQCPGDWVSLSINGTQGFRVRVDMDIRIHWIHLVGNGSGNLDTSGSQIEVTSSAANTRIFNVRLRTSSGTFITIPGNNGGNGGLGNTIIHQYWQAMHVFRAPLQTCSTPQGVVQVNLGMNFQNEFTGIGSTTAAKEFTFTVTCPSGYNAVRFWVGSPYRVASDPDGVVRLDPGSTASGFGVRIWNDPVGGVAQPLKFGAENTYLVHGYTEYEGLWLLNPGNMNGGDNRDQANANYIWERGNNDWPGGGNAPNYGQTRNNYNIRMKAALYQTEPQVTPGAYKTHILIYLVYK